MAKHILFLLFLISFFACKTNQAKETPTTANAETPIPTNVSPTPKQADTETHYFKGGGNEPGCNLVVLETDEGLSYDLILDYGDVKKSGTAKLFLSASSVASHLQLMNDQEIIEVSILDQSCSDDADIGHANSISLMYNGRTYIGCGDFANQEKAKAEAVPHEKTPTYICFRNDDKKEQMIWVSYMEGGKALQVKYKGQSEAIDLQFVKEEVYEGAHPTINMYYNEMYEGKINGTYKIIHSGIWDYVHYTRGKDSKVFQYTIDLDMEQYTKSPCF